MVTKLTHEEARTILENANLPGVELCLYAYMLMHMSFNYVLNFEVNLAFPFFVK